MFKVVFWWGIGTVPRLEGIRGGNSYQNLKRERTMERANWMSYDSWRREAKHRMAIPQRELKTKFLLLSLLPPSFQSPWVLTLAEPHQKPQGKGAPWRSLYWSAMHGTGWRRAEHGMAWHGKVNGRYLCALYQKHLWSSKQIVEDCCTF